MIKEINSQDLKQKLDKQENIILIDCREENEWNAGHIGQAKFLPLSEFQERYEEAGPADAEIIVQCRSGKRSMSACMILRDNGWKNITNLSDGILGWQGNGYETIK